jgi:hypothetical protein
LAKGSGLSRNCPPSTNDYRLLGPPSLLARADEVIE